MGDAMRMKRGMLGLGVAMVAIALAFPATAQEGKKKEKPHSTDEVRKDIANHRAMADAHLAAAKCLEAGKPVSPAVRRPGQSRRTGKRSSSLRLMRCSALSMDFTRRPRRSAISW